MLPIRQYMIAYILGDVEMKALYVYIICMDNDIQYVTYM